VHSCFITNDLGLVPQSSDADGQFIDHRVLLFHRNGHLRLRLLLATPVGGGRTVVSVGTVHAVNAVSTQVL
jgi:hypothetical protein